VSGTAAQSDRVPASVRSLAPVLTLVPAAEPKLSVAFILLHEFTLFAFSGFVDALRIAGDDFDNSRQRECRWTVIAPTLQPVRANCGVEITPWETFPDPAQFDYVVVIGGRMEPQRNTDPRILDYLRRVADRGVAIIGVCTATFVLARAGFSQAGQAIAKLALPTVMVQEGGYLCPALPLNLIAFLRPFDR
jgi:putative intracellular protease/amidase